MFCVFMKTRSIVNDSYASAIPLILFIVTIVVVGAVYTLFFVEIGFPLIDGLIPISASASRTFIMSAMYGLPLIVLLVGCVSLIIAGLKHERGWIG